MLQKIEVRPDAVSTALTLAFGSPSPSNRYVVTSIGGLGPVKAEIAQTSYAALDGSSIDNVRVGARNIVVTLRMYPNYLVGETIEDLREDLYLFLDTKKSVHLTFKDSVKTDRYILGIVETCEPSRMDPDSTVQLSILCGDAYFFGEGVTADGFTPGVSAFNPGNAPVGFELIIDSYIKFDTLRIARLSSTDNLELTIPTTEVDTTNERISISTVPRSKYIYQDPANIVDPFHYYRENLLRYKTGGTYFQLKPNSNNTIRLIGTSPDYDVDPGHIYPWGPIPDDIPLFLSFTPKYTGL